MSAPTVYSPRSLTSDEDRMIVWLISHLGSELLHVWPDDPDRPTRAEPGRHHDGSSLAGAAASDLEAGRAAGAAIARLLRHDGSLSHNASAAADRPRVGDRRPRNDPGTGRSPHAR